MTGPVVAATALAVAVLLPTSPRRRLDRPAGRAWPAGGRAGRWALAGVAAACGAVLAAVLLPPATGLAGAILGATVALRRHRRARRRRAAAEAGALRTALGVLVGELHAGADPVRAFTVAAAETDQPAVAAGLRAVAARARLGADVATGLREAAASSAMPALWDWLAVYWRLGCDHGMAVATLMRTAQCDIAARQRFSARVEAGMAGARASAGILSALPGLSLVLGQLIGARPVSFLLGRPGGVLTVVGVTLVCAGLLWSDRITGRTGS